MTARRRTGIRPWLAGLQGAGMAMVIAVTAWCSGARAQGSADSLINLQQWSTADGGNDHWYAVLAQTLNWQHSDSIAQTLVHNGMTGYLATSTSGAENAFILNQVLFGTNQPNIEDQFYLGGEFIGGTWMWSTGEAACLNNWAPGEPNHGADEDVLSMWGPNSTHGPPGTWNNTLRTDETNSYARFWSVIEWGDPVPSSPVCGDAYRDCGEECDGEPWCNPDCTIACDCGDGYVTCNEECDGEPWCAPDCTIACVCGDGYVTCNEECDGEPWCNPDCTLNCDSATVGDVNGDGAITAADIIMTVQFIFKGGRLTCYPMADVNANGSVTSSDVVYLVIYVFRGGPEPALTCTILNLYGTLCS